MGRSQKKLNQLYSDKLKKTMVTESAITTYQRKIKIQKIIRNFDYRKKQMGLR